MNEQRFGHSLFPVVGSFPDVLQDVNVKSLSAAGECEKHLRWKDDVSLSFKKPAGEKTREWVCSHGRSEVITCRVRGHHLLPSRAGGGDDSKDVSCFLCCFTSSASENI